MHRAAITFTTATPFSVQSSCPVAVAVVVVVVAAAAGVFRPRRVCIQFGLFDVVVTIIIIFINH